ncbi:hypothetical protein DXG01_003731 [Tephrocybe rancida]|nr:hypothetical protein DXG01_003731 [Tephrocybe rancida]
MFAPKNSRPSISRKKPALKDEAIRKPLKRSVQKEITSPPAPLVIKEREIKTSPGTEEFGSLPIYAVTASVSEATVIAEAFQSIADDKEQDLVVVLGSDGSLDGVFTSMDIVCHVIAVGLNPRTTHVREIITRQPLVCRETTDPGQNFDLMVSQNVEHMARPSYIFGSDSGVAGICHLAEVFHEHLDIIQRKLKASEDIYNALLAAKACLGTEALYSQMLASAEELLDKHDTTNLATAISTQPPSLIVTSRYSVRRVAQLMKEKGVSACVVEDQTTDCAAPTIVDLCTSKDLACYVTKSESGASQHPVRRAVRNRAVTVLSSTSVFDAARQMLEENVADIVVVDEKGRVLAIVSMLFLAGVILQEHSSETDAVTTSPADDVLCHQETSFSPLEAPTPQRIPPLVPHRAAKSSDDRSLLETPDFTVFEKTHFDVSTPRADVVLRSPEDSFSPLAPTIPQHPPPGAVLKFHKSVLFDKRYSTATSISQDDVELRPSSPSETISSRSFSPIWYREKSTDDRLAQKSKSYPGKTSTSPLVPPSPVPSSPLLLPPSFPASSPESDIPQRPLPPVPYQETSLTGSKLLEFMSRQAYSKPDLTVAHAELQHQDDVDTHYDSPPKYYSPQSEKPAPAVCDPVKKFTVTSRPEVLLLKVYHDAFASHLLPEHLSKGFRRVLQAQPYKPWQPKRSKLLALDEIGLYEISTDVHDELLRRQKAWQTDTAPRQRLSTLTPYDFQQLVAGVHFELCRRYPHLKGAALKSRAMKLLGVPGLQPEFRSNLLVATQRLSRRSGLHPTCYELKGIDLISDFPIASGGFADIYKGSFGGHTVCLKVLRIYQTTKVQSFFEANILVNRLQRATISDFGLSAVTDPKILHWPSQSTVGSKGGSVRWQAPELFDINDDLVHNSKATDIYALACVAYEVEYRFYKISKDDD